MKLKILFIIILFNASLFSQNSLSRNRERTIGAWEVKNGILIESKQDKTSLAVYNWNVFYNIFPKRITQK